MEEEDFVGCISCMSTTELCDLFAVSSDNIETYAKMLEGCFDVKVPNDLKYLCSVCAQKLEEASALKDQVIKSLAMLQSIRDEEYLDESIFEEPETKPYIKQDTESNDENEYLDDEEHAIQALDETTCIYCSLHLESAAEINDHVRQIHGLEPRTGARLPQCSLCAAKIYNSEDDHMAKCKALNSEILGRQFPCHFCDNVYASRKACFTHLRMKHKLKLTIEQTSRCYARERKQCHLCNKDFSQKQLLNKHLIKVHGVEIEKRKAFSCPLCMERVSYGAHFSSHLLRAHRVTEQVERLEFSNMDDFLLYKSAIQEESKYRYRKTTASKQTIEGLRSHYMCSQSGVYVYQGKGKRPAPERQIYKTGKACPAHMIVTETSDRVLVTFHKTHVGHGSCPYYDPREIKKPKLLPNSLILELKNEVASQIQSMQRKEPDTRAQKLQCNQTPKAIFYPAKGPRKDILAKYLVKRPVTYEVQSEEPTKQSSYLPEQLNVKDYTDNNFSTSNHIENLPKDVTVTQNTEHQKQIEEQHSEQLKVEEKAGKSSELWEFEIDKLQRNDDIADIDDYNIERNNVSQSYDLPRDNVDQTYVLQRNEITNLNHYNEEHNNVAESFELQRNDISDLNHYNVERNDANQTYDLQHNEATDLNQYNIEFNHVNQTYRNEIAQAVSYELTNTAQLQENKNVEQCNSKLSEELKYDEMINQVPFVPNDLIQDIRGNKIADRIQFESNNDLTDISYSMPTMPRDDVPYELQRSEIPYGIGGRITREMRARRRFGTVGAGVAYVCGTCGVACPDRDAFSRHVATHTVMPLL